MTLFSETVLLGRKFIAEADRLDEIFIQTEDPRALQGGAICEEANELRKFGIKILRIANQLKE